jgi:hypothetical protein
MVAMAVVCWAIALVFEEDDEGLASDGGVAVTILDVFQAATVSVCCDVVQEDRLRGQCRRGATDSTEYN